MPNETTAQESAIEITRAMIDAGVDAYLGYWGWLDSTSLVTDVDQVRREMVAEVFRRMVAKRRTDGNEA